jgi:integrase
MALMLYTGQRKSDAVKMGWQHVKANRIAVVQKKTGSMVDIPIHPELKRVLEGTPRGNLTFLMTEHGRPFTANGFGNWMRDRCDEAGLPQCTSHGLRKAMAKRLAEAGCSVNEIMAITGHATEGEVIRYTKEARKTLLADNAMTALQMGEARQSANPLSQVSKSEG